MASKDNFFQRQFAIFWGVKYSSFQAILRRYSDKRTIYPWQVFALRLQQEMLRSDQSGRAFFYVELPFAKVEEWPQKTRDHFWKAFFSLLSTNSRASDLIGQLENNSGIALVFFSSGEEGWRRFKSELERQIAHSLGNWEEGLIRISYPPQNEELSA
jgi:hypothetical protein